MTNVSIIKAEVKILKALQKKGVNIMKYIQKHGMKLREQVQKKIVIEKYDFCDKHDTVYYKNRECELCTKEEQEYLESDEYLKGEHEDFLFDCDRDDNL